MTSVHQCEVMEESAMYILVDQYHIDGKLCETYIYEIETTKDELKGERKYWIHCPYCGEKLEKEIKNG
jgi:hypothetical protein